MTGLAHEDFLGRWVIDRRIEDRLAQGEARFEGRADITKKAEGWQYAEEGKLSLPGAAPMQSERRYLWRPTQNGFDICFDDGRSFHQMRFEAKAQAAHWCDPDQYDVQYGFEAWPEWTSVWTVKGPRKDYTMTSIFRR